MYIKEWNMPKVRVDVKEYEIKNGLQFHLIRKENIKYYDINTPFMSVKRKRGRPRKVTVPEDGGNGDIETYDINIPRI